MYHTFLGLLKHYKAEDDTICQIIGFKFQSLHQLNQANKTDDSSQDSSLYLITSYLLMHKIIDLDSLMPHLYPNEQQIQQSYKEEFDAAKQYAKKLTTINLSETNQNESVPSQLDDTSSKSSANTTTLTQSANMQQQIKELKDQTKLENQKINLLKSLIEIGDFKTSLKLIEKLPQWYIALFNEQTKAICKSLDRNFVDRMYKKYNLLSKYMREKMLNNTSSIKSTFSRANQILNGMSDAEMSTDDSNELFEQFLECILPILTALGPSLSYDPILFTKLIRICVAFLDSKKFTSTLSSSSGDQKESTPPPSASNGNAADEINSYSMSNSKQTSIQILNSLNPTELAFYNQIYTLLNEIFLPSLSMISMNPCLAIELWNLLKLFPYEMRLDFFVKICSYFN